MFSTYILYSYKGSKKTISKEIYVTQKTFQMIHKNK